MHASGRRGVAGAAVDLRRGLVEAVRQAGRGHARGDLLHLGDPAPALGRRGPGGPADRCRQAGLGQPHSASSASSTPSARASARAASSSAAVPLVHDA